MDFHPYSKIFPLLARSDLEELAADIKANGLLEPIWTYAGQILDGRNRFLACLRANVAPTFREYTGADPLGFVVSLNIARRQLTVEQRALAAARIATLRRGDNQHTAAAASSQTAIAGSLGISVDSVQRARKVLEHGSEELKSAVEAGDVGLRKAAAVVTRPKPEQLAAAQADDVPDSREADADEEAHARQIEQELAASLDRILAADDRLAAAHEEIKLQAAEIATLKLSRDGYMNRQGEAVRQLKAERRKSERLEQELSKAQIELADLRERIAIMEAS